MNNQLMLHIPETRNHWNGSGLTARHNNLAKGVGFTMLELMVTIAIASILITVAVPSFTETINRNRINDETQRVFLILKQARNTAIQSGSIGIVCRSSDSAYNNNGEPRCRINGLIGDDLQSWNFDLIMYVPGPTFRTGNPGGRNNMYRINNVYDSRPARLAGVKSVSDRENADLNTMASTNDNTVWFNQDGSFGDDDTPSPFRIAVCDADNDASKGRLIEINAAGLVRIFETDPNDPNRDCSPA